MGIPDSKREAIRFRHRNTISSNTRKHVNRSNVAPNCWGNKKKKMLATLAVIELGLARGGATPVTPLYKHSSIVNHLQKRPKLLVQSYKLSDQFGNRRMELDFLLLQLPINKNTTIN